ncbi:MAG: hypothetical protein LBQ79_02410 [Deltaproteobacteria bacterium]|jgi:hypothetical protein|nr:hypothetical protein [Deltaproteobacteria bacterium]
MSDNYNNYDNGGEDDVLDMNLAGVVPVGANVPAGSYTVEMTEWQAYSRNTSGRKFIYTVADGPCRGKKLFDTIVMEGTTEAVEFGKSKVRSLAQAVGHANPDYVHKIGELMFRPFVAMVKVRPADGKYGPQSQVYDYQPVGPGAGQRPPARADAPGPAPGPGGSGGGYGGFNGPPPGYRPPDGTAGPAASQAPGPRREAQLPPEVQPQNQAGPPPQNQYPPAQTPAAGPGQNQPPHAGQHAAAPWQEQ